MAILILVTWFGATGVRVTQAQGPADGVHGLSHGPAIDSEQFPPTSTLERARIDRARQSRQQRSSPLTAVKTVRVYVLNFNPTYGGVPLSQRPYWYDPDDLMDLYRSDVNTASGQYIGFNIVTQVIVDDYPVKVGGFKLNQELYGNCLSDPTPDYCHTMIDYTSVLNQTYDASYGSACAALASGAVDEVWLWGGPWFGYWEYVIASPRTLCPTVGASFTVMGFSYERGIAEMLHDLGHRAEQVLRSRVGLTVWDRFDGQRARYGGSACGTGSPPDVDPNNTHAGNVHFPPNACEAYQYERDLAVKSDADDWLNYPNLTGAQTSVNRDTWSSDHWGFLMWWFEHFPRNQAVEGGNWWALLFQHDGLPNRIFLPGIIK